MPQDIFCSIVSREAFAHIIFENDKVIAFLDIEPASSGHALIVPRSHYAELVDVPDATIAALFQTAGNMTSCHISCCLK